MIFSLLTVGLLIGPRGNTLKKMENESGAKIAIRGKGSVKEGKGKSDAAHASNQDEDLHCLIMADTEEKVNKAKKLIHNVIETVSHTHLVSLMLTSQAASIPEGQNELKRNQLRELAALNGTLRDDENKSCDNCGEVGHRKYDCPQARNYTASIICRVCGNAGHMARDCPDRARGTDWRNAGPRPSGNAQDQDFANFMADIGGNATSDPSRQIGYQDGGNSSARPWERSNNAPWQQPQESQAPWQRNSGGQNPWEQNNRGHGGYDNGGYSNGGYNNGGYSNNNNYRSGGSQPWQQNNYGGGAPWQSQQNNQSYGSVPPPPPEDVPPPPPPGSAVPPPPPPA